MNIDHVDAIKEAIEDGYFCVLTEFATPSTELPIWPDFIASLNKSAHTKADFHVNDPFVETQVNFLIRRGIGYFYSIFDNSDVYINEKLTPIVQELTSHELPFVGSSIFLNLLTEDDYAHPHKDENTHNLYIQCEGSTTWTLSKDLEQLRAETYILNPGDAIFFTGDMFHSVSANTPRAGIALGMPR